MRAPFLRVQGGAVGRYRGGVPLVRTPSARMGKVGPGVASPCAPLSRTYTAAQSKGEGKGPVVTGCLVPLPARTGRRALVHPLPREWQGWGGGGVPSRAPFPRVHSGAVEGGRGGAGGDGVSRAPSRAYGGQGVRECAGATRRGVPSCTPLPREWKGRGWVASPFPRVQVGSAKGEGEAGVCVRMGRRWSTQGKGASACVPCFDEEKEGGGGEREEREEKGSVAEAQCACHVGVRGITELGRSRGRSYLVPIACHRFPVSSSHPRRPSLPLPICERGRPTYPSPTSRAEGMGCARGHPPPPSPSLPGPSPLAASPRAERETRARRPSPSPFDRAAVYMRERGTRGCATPAPPLPFARKGVHEGTPPRTRGKGHETPRHHRPLPFPLRLRRRVRAGKGRARARDSRPHLSHSRGRGAHEGHAAPVPPDRAALYAQERGAHGQAPPGPPFPFARKGRARGARVRVDSGMRGQAASSHAAPFTREGAHEATRFPMCRAAGPARSPCARVHRARTPFSRAIV
ncbi:hypothetical protein EDB83DRAFT_2325627 [Lactarius deliciosus]|nr:hypothetical protein EDB83DRAFT_2325627 [Lactarius deliciosus]